MKSVEEDLFAFLMQVVEAKTPTTVLRVAGGWVRDMLLEKPSHDIDIAVSNMSGLAFVNLITEYMKENGMKHSDLSVISARPEQSKHLETAIFHTHGFAIDFANLRKETYANSRIPTIEVGTPEEDSFRRDLTINALFFNINENVIEDFTGMGVLDLRNKICRTPIDSVQTFLDDPLRILRAIRFACKFGFSLDQKMIDAANLPSVQEAFKNKVSKERVWAEMIGVAEGDSWKKGFLTIDPVKACKLLVDFGLRDIVFKPSGLESWDDDQNNPHHDLDIWLHTMETLSFYISNFSVDSFEDNATVVLSIILHDLGKCCPDYRQITESGYTTYHEHEVASAKLAKEVLTKLNAPNQIMERVVKLVGEHMRLHCLPENVSDSALRRFVRDLGDDWRHSLNIAIADAYGKTFAKGDSSIRVRYENIRSRIEGILEAQVSTTIKRPINGNDLMVEFGLKPGKQIGQLLSILDEELLNVPNMSREDAIKLIRNSL